MIFKNKWREKSFDIEFTAIAYLNTLKHRTVDIVIETDSVTKYVTH